MASWLRTRLAAASGDGLGALAQLLGETRARLQADGKPIDDIDWRRLLDGPLPSLVASGEIDRALSVIQGATDR
jgi:hypothetical protein